MRMLLMSLAVVLLAGITTAAAQDDGTKLKVKEGQKAPSIDLPATQIGKVLPDKPDAKSLNLQDLVGKKNVVLFFFPKAMTKG